MSKAAFSIALLVLLSFLLSPLPVAAQVPDPEDIECLIYATQAVPICFASDIVLDGYPTVGDGSADAPWVVPNEDDGVEDDDDRGDLRRNMARGAQLEGKIWDLKVILCHNIPGCQHNWYRYTPSAGDDLATENVQGSNIPMLPPEVGVKLPFPYILGGGLLLGVVLVVTGVILRRRARPSAA